MGPLTIGLLAVAGYALWKRSRSPLGPAPVDKPGGIAKPVTAAGGPYPGAPGDMSNADYGPIPWQADKDLPNAGDCGWDGENGNAHLARYLHDRWKVPLPPMVETMSVSQLSQWLQNFIGQQLGSKPEVALDIDALMYGCLGKKIGAEIKRGLNGVLNAIKNPAQTYNQASDKTYVNVGGGGFNILPKL